MQSCSGPSVQSLGPGLAHGLGLGFPSCSFLFLVAQKHYCRKREKEVEMRMFKKKKVQPILYHYRQAIGFLCAPSVPSPHRRDPPAWGDHKRPDKDPGLSHSTRSCSPVCPPLVSQ